jgi:hypothetical protein
MYKLLVNMLFNSIKNKHQNNIDFIMAGFKKHLSLNNRVLFIFLQVIVAVSLKTDISFLKWNVAIRRIPIK